MGTASLSLIEQFANPFAHYHMSNHTLAHQKDGQQMMSVGFIASTRFEILHTELSIIAPRLSNEYIGYIILAPAVIFTLATPYAKEYLAPPKPPLAPKPANLQTACLKALAKAILKGNEYAQVAYVYADVVLNTACCVSYVAMIVLGMPIGGALGLASLGLLAFKRYDHLPERLHWIPGTLDRYMTPIGAVAEIISALVTPMSLPFRLVALYASISELSSYIINHPQVQKRLPEWISNPLIGTHVIPTIDWKNLNFATPLSVNREYIYAKEVGQLVPETFDEGSESTEILFSRLAALVKPLKEEVTVSTANGHHSHIEATNQEEAKTLAEQDVKAKKELVVLTKTQHYGLEKIKQGAISGKVDDLLPVDVDKFKLLLKSLIRSILSDPEPADKIKALAELGVSCTEGWSRDVGFILNPNSHDIKWQVHYQLAKLRGNILKAWIGKHSNEVQSAIGIGFDSLGGSNNVHLTSALEMGFWHRFRSYEGELMTQLVPHSIFGSLFLHFVLNQTESPPFPFRGHCPSAHDWIELIYINELLIGEHAEFFPLAFQSFTVFKEIEAHFSQPDIIINTIYEAIKPQYVTVEGVDEERRIIPWEAVKTWVFQMKEQNKLDMRKPLDPSEINGLNQQKTEEIEATREYFYSESEWIEMDNHKKYYLSRKGVIALLVDMGIIQAT